MFVKSPIHYMGNKYDLLPYLIEQFPKTNEVTTFYDVFGGSGTVSLNVQYDKIIYNELDSKIVDILIMIKNTNPKELIRHINNRAREFQLNQEGTDSRQIISEVEEIRNYYTEKYQNFRDYYNKQESKDLKDLFALSFWSFCNLMRFNSNNEFNTPYGNRCFTKTDAVLICEAHKVLKNKNIKICNNNAFDILKGITENNNQFLYFDPPYQNSNAIYNEKGWGYEDDEKLFNELDRLTKLGIKWAYSNVLSIKGKDNNHIEQWVNKNGYIIIDFEQKQYSSIGKGNSEAREVLIINYEQRVKKYSIFDFGVEI